jgi:GT2 family glycosyltransferase
MSSFGVVVGVYGDSHWVSLAKEAAETAWIAGADEVIICYGNNLSEARNKGARDLMTHYVTFLDADDKLHSDFFRHLSDHVDDSKQALYKPQTIDAFSDGTSIGPHFIRSNVSLFHSNSLVIGTTIRRSDFLDTAGFDSELPALEDWDLFLRLHIAGAEIVECEGVIYIISAGSQGRNSDQEKHRKAFQEIKRRYRTFI